MAEQKSPSPTAGYKVMHTMYRIRDPKASLKFYVDQLGMSLIHELHFKEAKFSLYFVGYTDEVIPKDPKEREVFFWKQQSMIELTHNHGTESDESFKGYHTGNVDPRGFGHVALSVPDVVKACDRLEKLGVPFKKKPHEGSMKHIAFVVDPDGYSIEIVPQSPP